MHEKDIEIRRMQEEDIDFILDLGNSTEELWLDDDIKFPFRKKDLVEWSESGDKLGYIVEVNNERIGFLLVQVDGEMAEIVGFSLEEEHRDEGYGKYTLREVLDKLEERGITAQMTYANKENERAIEFYSKVGFKKGEEVVTLYRGLD